MTPDSTMPSDHGRPVERFWITCWSASWVASAPWAARIRLIPLPASEFRMPTLSKTMLRGMLAQKVFHMAALASSGLPCSSMAWYEPVASAAASWEPATAAASQFAARRTLDPAAPIMARFLVPMPMA